MGKRGILVEFSINQNRGQVTTFIILGLLIIAVIGGAYYLKENVLVSEFEREAKKSAIVPEQIKPAKEFINGCIKETAENGIILLGMQGGYNTLPDDFVPKTSAGNIFSNSLQVFPGRSNKVAYWYYISGNNIETTQAPSLEIIEEELDSYIKENIRECLREFSLNDYTLGAINRSTSTSISVDVNILDEAVQIILDYPLAIKTKGLIFDMPKHYVSVDSSFGRLYTLARAVFEAEEKSFFLEEKTTDMLIAYETIPYSDVTFDCAPKIWFVSSVADSLKEILSKNMAFIRVMDSEYELSDIENSYFEWNIPGSSFKGISVDFSYSKNWPFAIEVTPSKGGIMESENIIKQTGEVGTYISSFVCINSYNFVYDLKYPVLISLFTEKGEVFRFATQVVIDNNQPRRDRLSDITISEIESAPEICEQGLVDLGVNTLAYDKFDPSGRLRFMDGVDVSFKCITTTCELGKSRNGLVKQRVPGCINGQIIAEKEDYYPGEMLVSTNLDAMRSSETSLVLEPYYNISSEIKIIDKIRGLRNPFDSEKVIFQFKGSSGYNTMFVYPDMKELRLIADTYDVESYVIGKSTWDIKIQGQTFEKCIKVPKGILGVFGMQEEKCVETQMPDMIVDEFIKGGVNFEWNADRPTLIDAEKGKKLFLYTYASDIPTTYEKLEDIYESIEFNSRRADFRLPEAG